MSDPYYNQGGSQYPSGGYSSGYGQQQQGYNQGYNQQQGGGYPPQDFGPPRRQNSYGPPQAGGFQHGQAGGQYGTYDASNPQGHSGYYGGYPEPEQQQYGQHQQQSQYGQQPYGQQPQGGHNDAFAANQAYQSQMGGQNSGTQPYVDPSALAAAQNHEFQRQSSDPQAPNYDPSAPPMTESDRGFLGAIGGGLGGHFLGKKANHGFLGTVGGAILGSITEDFAKDKKKKKHHSGGQSQSSWGGGSRW